MQSNPLDNPYAAPQVDDNGAGTAANGGQGLTDDEIVAFVDDNGDYYKKAWAKANRTGGFYAGFNLAALITSTLWLLYRRMYVGFVVMIAVQMGVVFIAGFVAALLEGNMVLAVLPAVILTKIGLGFLGNGLYLRRARRAAQAARTASGGQANLPFLKTQGGTSNTAVAVGMAINVLLGILGR